MCIQTLTCKANFILDESPTEPNITSFTTRQQVYVLFNLV